MEHPGPWGREPLADAPWPDRLGTALQHLVAAAGARMLAVRRHGSRRVGGPPEHPFVALAVTGPGGWAVSRRLDSPANLLTLPLAELAAGRRPDPAAGWEDAGALWGVCTQGTRDACCARLGRTIAQRLTAVDPEHTWEISHSGGHRFAPVLVAWPEGLVYGRVPVTRLGELTGARRRRHAVLDLLRGQMHLSEPEQAADVVLRRHLGLTALDAVRPVTPADPVNGQPPGQTQPGQGQPPDRTQAAGNRPEASQPKASQPEGDSIRTWWEAGGRRWRVDVRRVELPGRPASCGKVPEPAAAWRCDAPVTT